MTAFHVMSGASDVYSRPVINRIGISDVFDALRLGVTDFREKPSHYVFLCLMYPIAGIVLAVATSSANLLPIIFPLVSGFALLGPLAAIGLYEISRRRETGMDTSWTHALGVTRSPSFPSIVTGGLMLFAFFVVWLVAAQTLYMNVFGEVFPRTISDFTSEVFGTPQGMQLMLWGNLLGFGFAIIVLATTVVTFPILLDRDIGLVAAMETSLRATIANPVPVFFWGLIVAVSLAVATVPLFIGLALAIPILGHSTWHLYRKLVAPPIV